jgi:hypothetical protein
MARFIWSLQSLKNDALKFKTRTEWAKRSPNGYNAACRRNLISECCSHMVLVNKYWTDEEIMADAKLYKCRGEWQKKSKGFSIARHRNILDKCCKHMTYIHKKWCKESIKKEALKYASKKEWIHKSYSSYQAAQRYKIIAECVTHMIQGNIFWSIENIKMDALKYKFKSDWSANSTGYRAATRLKILDECCSHMKIKESCFTQDQGVIYMFVFCDGSAYIGLSIKIDQRFITHMREGKVYDKIQSGLDYMFLILEENIPNNILGNREIFFINEYKNAGVVLLNKQKGGSRGTIYTKWSTENIKKHALNYTSKSEWETNHSATYNAARRRGIYHECIKHMKEKRHKWSDEEIIADAQKFNSLKEWYTNSKSYQIANKRKLKNICMAHCKNS